MHLHQNAGMDKAFPRILGLDHVVLRTAQLPQMLAFYRDVLGCPLEKVQEALGLWQLRAGAALIDLLDCSAAHAERNGAVADGAARNVDHFCLELAVWDETALCSWLAAHGVRVGASGERYGARGSGPSLYVFDPDGNQVELKGPAAQLPITG